MFFGKPRDPTLATVPDEGAASVLLEALEAAGVEATVRRVPYDPYRPALTGTSFEIRVPPHQLAAAQSAVAALVHVVADDLDAQALAAKPHAEAPLPTGGGARAGRRPTGA
jgi:hypothetical protein